MNHVKILAFIPSCSFLYFPPPPSRHYQRWSPPSSSSLSILAEVTQEDNFIFMHVLIHAESSLNPFCRNSSFCALVITRANTDDNIFVATIQRGNEPLFQVRKKNIFSRRGSECIQPFCIEGQYCFVAYFYITTTFAAVWA